MDSERWRQVDRIFVATLGLSPEQRRELLDRECAGDDALRLEVESLLAHDRGDGFLERGASREAARLLAEGTRRTLIGQRIGRFEVEAKLGAGGMGEVYRARDPLLGRQVALKLIPAHLRGDPERRSRFRKEALATSALNHPNIITVYEILELEEHDVLVTELVDGVTLHERATAGPMPPAAALQITIQIARGLAAAHAVGVVHRDVKPQNVMVRRDGLVKVLDFGIAKSLAFAHNESDTTPGKILGTVAYMSPEQARGLPVDARTDVWSLGVILYQLLTGEQPFRGSSPSDALARTLLQEPEPPSAVREGVPPELDRVVARALAKDREQRYADGAAFTTHLERVLESLDDPTSVARQPAPPRRDPARRGPLSRRAAIGAAGLVVALLGVAGVLLVRGSARDSLDSLAVLPLVNSSGDPQTEYLSDGISESLIQSLAEAGDFKVMSRDASFRYRGREVDAKTVADELGVRGILTGRLAARDDGVAVSLELIDTRDGSHVWGARYDVGTADLATLHERVARDLRRRLNRRLTSEQEARIARLHTDDAAAYQLYLQGRFYWHRPLREDYDRSRDYFLRAIETDPDYALAWAGLGHYYGRGATAGLHDPEDYWPRAEQAAQRTLELDPDLPELGSLVAAITFYWRRDWAQGERLMREAVEVFPEAVSHMALFLCLSGKPDEALETLRDRIDDDPNPGRSNRILAQCYYFTRRYEEAVAQARTTLEVEAADVTSWELLGDALWQLGREAEALDAWRQMLVVQRRPELGELLDATVAEWGPDAALVAVSRARLAALLARRESGEYVPAHNLARVSLRAGLHHEALEWAKKAFDERNRLALELLVEPVFDPLRDEPRFREGVRRLALPM